MMTKCSLSAVWWRRSASIREDIVKNLLAASFAIAILAACSEEPAPPAEHSIRSSSDTATAAAEAAAMIPLEKLPAGAPPAPSTGGCAAELCEVDKASFVRRDWPKAWQGDYAAQRNVAYCRSTGCNGAVETAAAEACAWRSIIVVAHVGVANDTDTGNLKIDCGKLDDAGIAVAITSAENIHRRIYGKPLPTSDRPIR